MPEELLAAAEMVRIMRFERLKKNEVEFPLQSALGWLLPD
jgi:hypothetical protein